MELLARLDWAFQFAVAGLAQPVLGERPAEEPW